ncbi:unnamed protein product [Medioppia subpectinata]|uniref:C-type lectin domain-containing protein n=1 Tax=Medioppia subpectinata TaxID=1979941 RepID=A0A7R9L0F7_9ACAR|nr:unnamed protein product [Medioppia subpectinata]CAG2112998.1 unnamed protein product [Medioppia subpectinata]
MRPIQVIFSEKRASINGDSICGKGDAWEIFHDEYYDICYIYLKELGLADYATVQAACAAHADGMATLPTVHTQAQQDFLTQSLFTKHEIVNGVWIDAKANKKAVTWADGTSYNYNVAWVEGRPIDVANECVEMVPDKAPGNMGKWLDGPCSKKNEVVCEKVVLWSAQKTQRMIADNRKLISSEGVCGDDWDLFRDDYYDICYKYIPPNVADYASVVTFCQTQSDSTLATINSPAEQQFLTQMLFTKYKVVESVWLDASLANKHVVWRDRTSGEYENWIPGRPIADTNCVEMVPDIANLGKWLDQPCTKKNAFVCKRVVMRPGEHIERLIRDNRRVLDETIARVSQLEGTQVPVGFIYVQMPDQAEPKTLWPAYTWSDVTATYAGQFFRAEGNGSLAFGKGAQAENAPRLSQVQNAINVDSETPVQLTPGVWSKYIYTGSAATGENKYYHRFLETAGEVRPRNQAVRIFKRTK